MARSTAVHLAASERAHVTIRNLTPLGNADVSRVGAAFERALRRSVRNGKIVEVTFTISDNVKGYLLVSETFHADQRAVEMRPVAKEPSVAPAPVGISISKKLLWEQSAPILDLALTANFMFVLDTTGVSRYERREGQWDRVGMLPAASSVRDPRGKLDLEGDSLTVQLPGMTCRGTWTPSVLLHCDAGSMLMASSNLLGTAGLGTAGLETAGLETAGMKAAEPLPAHFSEARTKDIVLLAEMDGRTHAYDSSGKAMAAFDGWGTDFVAIQSGCAANRIAATSPSYGDSGDSIALYDVTNNAPVRLSDPAELPGPVTALWPVREGALAVVRNVSTGRYEAYSISVDCGR